MPSRKSVVHSDSELQIASHYLRYHIRMYVETLLDLQGYSLSIGWDTFGNAILEDHLVHARALINFMTKCDSNSRKDDVLAEDYFHNCPDIFSPLQDAFLISQAQDIGGQVVHITKKAMPKLRSQKDWPIREIAKRLAPAIETFLVVVSETKLADRVKQDCLSYVASLRPPEIPVSLHAST
jgi:hypothetical protein